MTNVVTCASTNHIFGYDIRQKSLAFSIGPKTSGGALGGVGGYIRDIDINPNNPHCFVSCGDDYKIKFWDQRNMSKPLLKVFSKNSHWVWRVQYNPTFPSLLISSSSDGTVNLWNVDSSSSVISPPSLPPAATPTTTAQSSSAASTSSTPSSAPKSTGLAPNLTIDSESATADRLIKAYEDHEDSVYSVCWSKCGDRPWDWASLSYDGRVVINRVPEKEATKVLDKTAQSSLNMYGVATS